MKRNGTEKYYDKFVENGGDDLDDLPLFDDVFLKYQIGIKSEILRKKFLIKCNEYSRNECIYNRLWDKWFFYIKSYQNMEL